MHIADLGEFHYVSTISIMEPKKELHCKNKESIKPGTGTDENLKCSQNTMTALAYPNSDIADMKTIKRHLNPQAKSGIEKKQRVICNMNTLIQSFHNSIECGPEYICTCCDQLWYRSSVQLCNSSKYKLCGQNMIKVCITNVKSVDNNEWTCNNCHSNLLAGKLPECVFKGKQHEFP